jgi:hypothetical protein
MTDRPTEIEITPTMIEAGEAAFMAFDDRFEDASEAVVRIYVAMKRAATEVSVAPVDYSLQR